MEEAPTSMDPCLSGAVQAGLGTPDPPRPTMAGVVTLLSAMILCWMG
jgi:hypothetical protein